MKKNYLILLLFSFIAFAGCKKVGRGDVSGTVTEKGTGLPFPNVGVYIERTTKSGEDDRLDPTIVANTVTDANGHYDLSFHMQFNYLYRIYSKPIEDVNGKTYSAVDSKPLPTKNANINFMLPPFAYMKVHLLKSSYIVTTSAWLVFGYSKSINLNVHNYPFDSIQGVYRVNGNDSLNVSWQQNITISPLWVQGQNTVYINKGDTLYYTINFN